MVEDRWWPLKRRMLALALVTSCFVLFFLVLLALTLFLKAVVWLDVWPGRPTLPLAEVLPKLQSPWWFEQEKGLRDLARVPPDHTRREVAEALKSILQKSPFPAFNTDAVERLGEWGGPEDVPELERLIRQTDVPFPSSSELRLRDTAIAALGQVGGAEAGRVLVERLKVPRDRPAALAALRQVGPDAQAALAALRDDAQADPAARQAAWDLLARMAGP